MNTKKKEGECCVCTKKTEMYCGMCANGSGEFDPVFFCDEHYETTVMTGNCCSGNESQYAY